MNQTPTQRQYMELVQEICGPNTAAYRWFSQAMDAALLWDHVVDGDPIDKERAHGTFQALTMDWAFNEFYHANRLPLVTAWSNCVDTWRNGLQGESPDAFLLYTQLPATLCLLLHGQAGLDKYMPRIHALIKRERFEDRRRDHPLFLIVGLPRTRSAWFSAFLTDGDVTCHHELVRNCDQASDYPLCLKETQTPIIGDASPSLPLYYDSVREFLPEHKIVFIVRDSNEARQAYYEMLMAHGINPGPHLEQWGGLTQAFAAMRLACPDAMTFSYSELDKPGTIREISEYCTGLPFNETRWKLYNELKITAIPSKVLANQRIMK